MKFNSAKNKNSWKKYYWSLREKCPYSELFWPVFFRTQAEFGEIQNISPNSVRMQKNTDQKNSEYRHFLYTDVIEWFKRLENQLSSLK